MANIPCITIRSFIIWTFLNSRLCAESCALRMCRQAEPGRVQCAQASFIHVFKWISPSHHLFYISAVLTSHSIARIFYCLLNQPLFSVVFSDVSLTREPRARDMRRQSDPRADESVWVVDKPRWRLMCRPRMTKWGARSHTTPAAWEHLSNTEHSTNQTGSSSDLLHTIISLHMNRIQDILDFNESISTHW